VLSQRETRMLTALLRAEPLKDVVSRPQLMVLDNQTGFVQATQQVEVVTGLEAETKNGATVYTPKVEKLDLGMTLKVTPRFSADGKYINLRVESQYTDLAGPAVQVPVTPAGAENRLADHGNAGEFLRLAPRGTNEQSVKTTVMLPAGGTVAINSEAAAGDRKGKQSGELLWVLTAHAIRGQSKPGDGGAGTTPIRP